MSYIELLKTKIFCLVSRCYIYSVQWQYVFPHNVFLKDITHSFHNSKCIVVNYSHQIRLVLLSKSGKWQFVLTSGDQLNVTLYMVVLDLYAW